MYLRVSVPGKFQLKLIPTLQNLLFLNSNEIHYIGGTEVLPAPLEREAENDCIMSLGTVNEEDARKKLKQLADGQYGIIYITEAVAAQLEEEIEQYRENTLPAIIQIPGVAGNMVAGVNGVKKTVEQAVGSDILFGGVSE